MLIRSRGSDGKMTGNGGSPMKKSGLVLVGFILVTLAAGALGSLFTDAVGSQWYRNLEKPPWNPPSWVFGPVWTTLYILMAVAAWQVWRRAKKAVLPLSLFFVQLALNAAWSPVFFGLRSLVGSVVVIVPLLVLVAVTTVLFWRVSRAAGILMLPYLAWLAFATALNISIMNLNS